MKIKSVEAVKPFGACFDGKSIGKKNGVPDVPGVNLVLEENEGVSYEINGHNSMFEVKKDVTCSAFVDGGKEATAGIVIGGYQMEDRILEFDLSTSTLRFRGIASLHLHYYFFDYFNTDDKISTMSNFTVLHSSIYKPFVKDSVKHAEAMKMKRVEAVKPFGACFDGKSIGKKNGVPDMPGVNLVLEENEGVSYEINGHNSMFEVKKDVMCLAFVDGGKEAKTGIVLGGYQMEDRILEFDLSISVLRFSNSLLLHNNASCSNPSSLKF
ncbi:hypothetical protein PIB30_035250 [Stylosanthes scabra]|uniref:Xylanase inhibitor C-terminal domain-containing protein n=1 Tax=Stylosanthes scabra TaxID=79078 RepID=A0ABU6UD99_9FABA|nr:hypothetical protein [Stylosanthes scabra]